MCVWYTDTFLITLFNSIHKWTTGYHFIDYVQYSTTTVQKFKFKYEYDDEGQDQDHEETANEQDWINMVVANKPRLAIFIHLACGRSAASSF